MRSDFVECAPRTGHRSVLVLAVGVVLLGAASAQIPTYPPLRHKVRHVVERTSFGVTPQDLWDKITDADITNYLNEQIAVPTTGYGGFADELIVHMDFLDEGAGLDYATHTWKREDLRAKQLILALESPYQLREVMTWFWEQHFSTYIQQVRGVAATVFVNSSTSPPSGVTPESAAVYHEWRENQMFRELAFTDFYSLLRGSLESPAMRYYLHLVDSECRGANEDYGREVLELHTVNPFTWVGGVLKANYTTEDIQAAAEVFRGLTVDSGTGLPAAKKETFMGSMWYCHWPVPVAGISPVMGQRDLFQGPGQGHMDNWRWTTNFNQATPNWPVSLQDWRNEVYSLSSVFAMQGILRNLVDQDETKRFVCTKLIHWFCGDADPVVNGQLPADLDTLLQRCVSPAVWGANGNIKAVLGEIFASYAFRSTRHFARLRNPLELAVSQARILDARLTKTNTKTRQELLDRLDAMLQVLDATGAMPHEHPAPDGYPLNSLSQPGSAVYWQHGTYAARIHTDSLTGPGSTPAGSNVPYDPYTVLQTEIARTGSDWTSVGQVARAATRLFYEGRYSGRDMWNARKYLDAGSPWGSVANTPALAKPRIREMVAFLRALPQAAEK